MHFAAIGAASPRRRSFGHAGPWLERARHPRSVRGRDRVQGVADGAAALSGHPLDPGRHPYLGGAGAHAGKAGVVRTTTRPAHPHGCLGVQGALATSISGQDVRDLLVAWRDNGYSCIRERFQRAVDDGDLPPQTDPGLLARYLTTLAFAIAVQAASGVGRDELQEMADAALRSWPVA
ncbi:UNVERIFIED_CONTAM: hypothetical protein RKD50_008914 [Streptomyces canus]